MPGPAPSANPRRRNVRPTTTQLPAEGYQGPIPDWPLSEQAEEERLAWESLWRLPQADAWARGQHERSVARYVRALVLAEQPRARAASLAEVRQMEDRLGLTPMSMLRLRWEITPTDGTQARDDEDDEPAVPDVRRLYAV